MMGNYGLLLAYAFCFDNPLLETIYFGMNVVFFVMELRYVTSGELVMTIGDIGNVEFELIFTIMLGALGIFGNEGLQKTIGYSFGVAPGSKCPIHLICEYQWCSVVGTVFFIA